MSDILVVDDEPGIRDLLREILEEEGYEVRLAADGNAARAALAERTPALVLLDIWMPDLDGLTLLKEWASAGRLTMPVVMMSGHGTIHTAVEATRLGALDFLEKPIPYKKLLQTVAKALDSRPAAAAPTHSLEALGCGETVRQLAQRLRQAAQAKAPILLSGEPGVGFEVCARFLHVPGTSWVAPETMTPLIERPLDWLHAAKGGLLFLREVAHLTPLQQKGLQLLLARREEFHVQMVCASSENLAQKAAAGTFSRDLYNLLARVAVRVPALREHPEDIPSLVEAALAAAAARTGQPPRRLGAGVLERLMRYDWPGNLDELNSVMHSLAVTALSDTIELAEVEAIIGNRHPAAAGGLSQWFSLPLKEARDAFERAYLEALLAECGGSMTRVAERSGLERTHLYRKIKQLGVKSGPRNSGD